ncbi:hypothetical protein D3C76_1336660 [compost metagenome]
MTVGNEVPNAFRDGAFIATEGTGCCSVSLPEHPAAIAQIAETCSDANSASRGDITVYRLTFSTQVDTHRQVPCA